MPLAVQGRLKTEMDPAAASLRARAARSGVPGRTERHVWLTIRIELC